MDNYQGIWKELIAYNDMEMDTRRFASLVFASSLVVGGLAGAFGSQDPLYKVLIGIAGFVVVHVLVYSRLVLGANSRASKVEEVLADFLALVGSNIRAGLTPDKALIVSARDEFGPLTHAIQRAGKSSITGMPLEQVFAEMGEHIKSNTLEKTIRLIVEGLHSGGDMAELMERTALDIRKFRSVRKEVNSVILNYVLFIIAAVTFGAPLLYGVSSFLVDIMLIIKSRIGGGESLSTMGQAGIFKGQLMLTPEAVSMFASAAILITVFFGCMAVGIMTTGRRMDGLKYFPILGLVGLGILFSIRFALGAVLGGMLAGSG